MALNGGFQYREQLDHRCRGITVLDHLTRKYGHSSRQDWLQRLVRGEISLDGVPMTSNRLLKPGQWLVWRRPPWEEPDVPLGYAVLHEDDDLLAVAKPRGLPTVPAGGFLDHTLLHLVRKAYPEAVPLHRLGRGTSGVVLFARTTRARSMLCAAWRNRKVIKVYRALVKGRPLEERFVVNVPIGPVTHPRLGSVHAACPGGKPALSHVQVLDRRLDSSLVEVTIETGRPHQIRIHMAAAGHPLVGDPLYTTGGRLAGEGSALPGETGYLLHAERLCVEHPATGVMCGFSCFPPPLLRSEASR